MKAKTKVRAAVRRTIVFVAVGAGLAVAPPAVASAHSIHPVNQTGYAQGAGWFMRAWSWTATDGSA